ncbi:MarR family winged helix-turn-helix transcriptional regulator [Kitasatospora sp. NPDC001175]|uniref:MarR family winged helix-turn-helix transcriptional regulator n=1 Tax=Kitasatospora sp. NPDC001175 TaxID=3157103 RepID=UPI003D03CD8D
MGHDAQTEPSRPIGGQDGLSRDTTEVVSAVMTASRLFVALSARAVAGVDAPLSLPQLRALVVLQNQGPIKLAVLAGALAVNPSTAMRTVDKLEGLRLVDRQTNPVNRREVVLRLTPQGDRLVDQVLTHRHREIAKIVARLSPDQRSTLVQALHTLVTAADEPALEPFLDMPNGIAGT